MAWTWSFTPDEIDLPADAEVAFRATSSEVIHGSMIVGTNVNMMLIPGEVTTETYKFSRHVGECDRGAERQVKMAGMKAV